MPVSSAHRAQPPASAAERARRMRWLLLFSVLFIGMACDQWTKSIARNVLVEGQTHTCCADLLRIQLVYNDGAFLSLGGSLPKHMRDWLFRGGVLLLVLGMLVYVLRAPDPSTLVVIALALCIAGGGSNLVDRWAYDGSVLDFLNLGIGPLRTGIFNVADMYIMVGAGLLLLSEYHAARSARTGTP